MIPFFLILPDIKKIPALLSGDTGIFTDQAQKGAAWAQSIKNLRNCILLVDETSREIPCFYPKSFVVNSKNFDRFAALSL